MFPLVSLVHGRNTQDEWVGPSFSCFCDGKSFKGRPSSFSENSLVLRRCVFCRDSKKVESNVTTKGLARNTRLSSA